MFIIHSGFLSNSKRILQSGSFKYVLQDYREAIQDFNKVIKINPECAMAYNNRGLAKIIIGDKKETCLDWSKAGELGYTYAYDLIKKYYY